MRGFRVVMLWLVTMALTVVTVVAQSGVPRGLRLIGDRFYLNQGYDWVNPHDPDDLRVRYCGVIEGTWLVSTKDLLPMVVAQSDCRFNAAFWNTEGTILHEISGTVGVGQRMTVVRRAPGCTAELYGEVFLGDSGLWWEIDGTSGGCGLAGHRETRLFDRQATYEQAMGKVLSRVPPILVSGLRDVIIRNVVDHARNEGYRHDAESSGGGGGGKPSEMRRDIP